MKKQFKSKQQETQIIWKNTTHDPQFNPERKYYGIVDFDKSPSIKVEYACRVRSEAVAIFIEEARMLGGKLGVVSAYK